MNGTGLKGNRLACAAGTPTVGTAFSRVIAKSPSVKSFFRRRPNIARRIAAGRCAGVRPSDPPVLPYSFQVTVAPSFRIARSWNVRNSMPSLT